MIEQIKTVKDVEAFAKQLVAEGVSFHPDDDFEEYIRFSDKTPVYTKEEAEVRNRLMDACFTLCANENVDIYDIMYGVVLKETGMDKYIQLSSTPDAEMR